MLNLVKGPEDSVWVLASLLVAGVASMIVSYGLTTYQLGWPRLKTAGIVPLIRSFDHAVLLFVGIGWCSRRHPRICLPCCPTPAQVGYFGAAERFATIGLSLMGAGGAGIHPHHIPATRAGRQGWRARHHPARCGSADGVRVRGLLWRADAVAFLCCR